MWYRLQLYVDVVSAATHPQEAVEEEVAQVAAAAAAARLGAEHRRLHWSQGLALDLCRGMHKRMRACQCACTCTRCTRSVHAVACRATSTAGSAFANDGQPVPESNFCRESKSGMSQPAQR